MAVYSERYKYIYFANPNTASKAIEGTMKFTVSYEVTPVAGGTNLQYRIVADSGLGGAFGRAMEPIVEKAQTKVVKGNLDTLVGLLEQRAA